MTEVQHPICDTCFAAVVAINHEWVCTREPSHDVLPLRGPVPVATREQPCATCGGHVVSIFDPPRWWCRVDTDHAVD